MFTHPQYMQPQYMQPFPQVPVSAVPAPAEIPKFIEDPTYHGHGNRVFVDASLTLSPEWIPTTSEATPAGMKAYMAPEWAYLI
jgi:hypothetical protein